MILSMILARSENNVIGAANAIPWQAREEQHRFKAATLDKTIVIGRKTYESLPGSLPRRSLMVVTSRNLPKGDAYRVSSLQQAIERAKHLHLDELIIAGGASLYNEAMPLCDVIYSSIVHVNVEGDTFATPIPESRYTRIWSRSKVSSHPGFTYETFVTGEFLYHPVDPEFGLLSVTE